MFRNWLNRWPSWNWTKQRVKKTTTTTTKLDRHPNVIRKKRWNSFGIPLWLNLSINLTPSSYFDRPIDQLFYINVCARALWPWAFCWCLYVAFVGARAQAFLIFVWCTVIFSHCLLILSECRHENHSSIMKTPKMWANDIKEGDAKPLAKWDPTARNACDFDLNPPTTTTEEQLKMKLLHIAIYAHTQWI